MSTFLLLYLVCATFVFLFVLQAFATDLEGEVSFVKAMAVSLLAGAVFPITLILLFRKRDE